MRVAVFTSKYPARVATFFERDMLGLLEAGIEIDVFALAPHKAESWRNTLSGVAERLPRERVHHLSSLETLGGLARLLRPRGTGRDLLDIVRSAARFGPVPLAKTAYVLSKARVLAPEYGRRFDHVLAYWGNYAGTAAYLFHRLAGRPVPFTLWLHAGVDLYRDQVFLRRKLLYADNVITCCDFNRTYLRRHFADIAPSFMSKLHVVQHGLDLAQFPFRPSGRKARTVVAVGRLSRYKGFEYLLHAVKHLTDRGVELSVELVGGGDQRRALQRLTTKLGIGDRVRFRGWLPFPAVRQAMSEATILVHPSEGLGDGLPNVIREAMALGTPVVGSQVAGIPDALGNGCGVLVPPRDPAALAVAINRLLEDPERRARIADRARRRVEEDYDVWRNAAALAALMRDTPPRPSSVAGRAAASLPRLLEAPASRHST